MVKGNMPTVKSECSIENINIRSKVWKYELTNEIYLINWLKITKYSVTNCFKKQIHLRATDWMIVCCWEAKIPSVKCWYQMQTAIEVDGYFSSDHAPN